MLNLKSLAWLAGVTLLAVAAAVLVRHSDRNEPVAERGLYFPQLLERANDVAGVEIKSAAAATTLVKDGDQWGVSEKHGYPAATEKVRELILGLARLERIEAKTSNPDLHGKLDLNDIGDEDSNAKLIRLTDGDGNDLARLMLGKQRFGAGAAGRSQYYVRSPDDPQAWLVEGLLPEVDGDWIRTALFEPELGELRSVTVDGGDGAVKVSRTSAEDADFTLEGLGPGEEIDSQYAVNQIPRSFRTLTLEDVERVGPDTGRTGGRVIVGETFDGLRITLSIHKRDDQYLARVEAEYTVGDDPADEIQAGVKSRNDAWRQWVYVLPDYQVENIIVERADLIRQDTETQSAD